MVILIAVLLTALSALWIAFPLFLRDDGAGEGESAVIAEEIEREIDALRTRSETAAEHSPES